MKIYSLKDKLELYYDKLQNPVKVIGNWSIIDKDAWTKIKKYKIININDVTNYTAERVITLETKNNYIAIKYSPNFIASKIIDTEYNYIIDDWDLIAVDKNYLYKGKQTEPMTNKQLLKLLELNLTIKAKKNLEYFN